MSSDVHRYDDEDPARRAEADALFAAFLARIRAGEDLGIDDLVTQRPELEHELRRRWSDAVRSDDETLDLRVSLTRFLDEFEQEIEDDVEDPDSNVSPEDLSAYAQSEEVLRQFFESSTLHGQYRIDDVINQGGMGIILLVYDRVLRRSLAMKTLLPGATALPEDRNLPLVVFFLKEAQVTGQLDHPAIPPVHDVGQLDDRRPYFTTKFVKGETLRRILGKVKRGEEDWSLNRMISVLRRVCEAVAYAHSKGVIHRDLKPANILVGRFGQTYLIDWGLAHLQRDGPVGVGPTPPEEVLKIWDPASGEPDKRITLGGGKILGTAPYMAPEQVIDGGVVDERADVYALGAILYQLLTLRMPYVEPGEMPVPGLIIERLRRGAPRPVIELSPEVPPTLLDLCERAMARDPTARIQSAEELGRELADYLEDISEDREEARRQARRAEQLNDFLLGMLSLADPANARSEDLTVRDALERAAERIEDGYTDNPIDEAELRVTLGVLFREIGDPKRGLEHLRRGLDLATLHLGADHRESLSYATQLGLSLRELDQLEQAEAILRRTWDRQRRILGIDDADTLRTQYLLATVLRRRAQRTDETVSLLRDCLKRRRRLLGLEHVDTRNVQSTLAQVLHALEQHQEALALQQEVVDSLRSIFDEDHPSVLIARSELAMGKATVGELQEAAGIFQAVFEISARVYDAAHASHIKTTSNLAWVLGRLGRSDEAEALLREALTHVTTRFRVDHVLPLTLANNLALLLIDVGRFAEAEQVVRPGVEAAFGRDQPDDAAGRFRFTLARAIRLQGRTAEARAHALQSLAFLEPRLAPEHPWIVELRDLLRELGGDEGVQPEPDPEPGREPDPPTDELTAGS